MWACLTGAVVEHYRASLRQEPEKEPLFPCIALRQNIPQSEAKHHRYSVHYPVKTTDRILRYRFEPLKTLFHALAVEK